MAYQAQFLHFHLGVYSLLWIVMLFSLKWLMLADPVYTVCTESIQTPFNFSLFVILQPFAKII